MTKQRNLVFKTLKNTSCVWCLPQIFLCLPQNCVNCTCNKLCCLLKLCKCTAQKIAVAQAVHVDILQISSISTSQGEKYHAFRFLHLFTPLLQCTPVFALPKLLTFFSVRILQNKSSNSTTIKEVTPNTSSSFFTN